MKTLSLTSVIDIEICSFMHGISCRTPPESQNWIFNLSKDGLWRVFNTSDCNHGRLDIIGVDEL